MILYTSQFPFVFELLVLYTNISALRYAVQTDLNIHICFVMRDTNAYGVPGSRGEVPKTPG